MNIKNLTTYTLIAMLSGIALVFDVLLMTQFALPKMLILRVGVLVLCLIWLAASRKGLLLPITPLVMYSGVAFGTWAILATFTALHGYTALHGVWNWYNGLWNNLTYLLLFYLVAVLPIDRLKALKAYIYVMAIVAVYAILQAYRIDWMLFVFLKSKYLPIPIFFDGRPSSTIGNPVSMAVCLMLAMPFSLYFTVKSNKWLWGFLTMILLTGVIVSQARAVVLAMGLTGFIITVIYGWRYITRRRLLYSITALLIGLVLTVLLLQNFTNPDTQKRWNPSTMFQEYGMASRIEYAKISYKMITDKPKRLVTGIGLDNLSIAYPLYRTPEAIKTEQADKIPTQVHNVYLNYALTGGIPLLLFYGAFIFSVLKSITKTPKTDKKMRDIINMFRVERKGLPMLSNTDPLAIAFKVSIIYFLLQDFTGWATIPTMTFFYVVMGLAVRENE